MAAAAQTNLEEAANNVRVITAALRAAQESVANTALRAQTAQLQLAAHDQLLFTARQHVDALSAQMVGLQAEVSITADAKNAIDLTGLLNRLREPLRPEDQPTPIPIAGPALDVAAANDSAANYHQFKPHSADPNGPWATEIRNQPHKRSSSSSSSSSDSIISVDDLNALLNWVHNAREEDMAKSDVVAMNDAADAEAMQQQQQNKEDAVAVRNGGADGPHMPANFKRIRAPNDNNYRATNTYRLDNLDAMEPYEPKTNDEIVSDSLKAVEYRHKRRG